MNVIHGSRAAACLVALAAGLVVAAPAGAAQPASVQKTHKDKAGVVRYAFDAAEMPGATVVSQRGTAKPGDRCRFTASGAGGPHAGGPVVTRMAELTFDAKRCTRTLAAASYPIADAPPAIQARLAKVPGATAQATDGAVAAAATRYIGVLKLSVELASQIDVSSTQSRVEWSGTPSCVNWSTHNASWGWYTLGGWGRDSYRWNHGLSCARAFTDTYGKFSTGSWCWPATTTTEHKKTWFEGRPNGGWWWSYSADKSGACSGLLHYDYLLTTP